MNQTIKKSANDIYKMMYAEGLTEVEMRAVFNVLVKLLDIEHD